MCACAHVRMCACEHVRSAYVRMCAWRLLACPPVALRGARATINSHPSALSLETSANSTQPTTLSPHHSPLNTQAARVKLHGRMQQASTFNTQPTTLSPTLLGSSAYLMSISRVALPILQYYPNC
mmetsp:Transcript_36480/g.72657  ORF Transcript_36480/g.72657 Transcript_36480/m.72657 type:complete len:125 (-) Transcript_36480:30-404(-)